MAEEPRPQEDQQDDPAGGWGETAPNRRDTTLAARAIRERWPLSDKVRVAVLQRLVNICDADHKDGKKASQREVIAAAKAILSADKLNLDENKLALDHAKFDRDTQSPVTEVRVVRVHRSLDGAVELPPPGAGEGTD